MKINFDVTRMVMNESVLITDGKLKFNSNPDNLEPSITRTNSRFLGKFEEADFDRKENHTIRSLH